MGTRNFASPKKINTLVIPSGLSDSLHQISLAHKAGSYVQESLLELSGLLIAS